MTLSKPSVRFPSPPRDSKDSRALFLFSRLPRFTWPFSHQQKSDEFFVIFLQSLKGKSCLLFFEKYLTFNYRYAIFRE